MMNNSRDDPPARQRRPIASHRRYKGDSPSQDAAALDPCNNPTNTLDPYNNDPHPLNTCIPAANASKALLGHSALQQHNSACLFGSPTVPSPNLFSLNTLELYAAHPDTVNPYTPPPITPHLGHYDARHAGSKGAVPPPSGGHEKLNDVTTWKMETILKVATELSHNPYPALFDTQDEWDSVTQETVPQSGSGEANNGEYEDEAASGACGGVLAEALNGSRVILPTGSCGTTQRKLKMHEWLPQTDPELERRRRSAVRQKKQRQKEKQKMQQLHRDLGDTLKAVSQLASEALWRKRRVQVLEQLAAQEGCYEGPLST